MDIRDISLATGPCAQYWVYAYFQEDTCLLGALMVGATHSLFVYTVEPPNNGHVGTRHFVLYREVVLSSEVKNVLV